LMMSPVFLRKAFLLVQLQHPQVENTRAIDTIELHQWYYCSELRKQNAFIFPPSKLALSCPVLSASMRYFTVLWKSEVFVTLLAPGTKYNVPSTQRSFTVVPLVVQACFAVEKGSVS
jgi:hypothetical protein